jgi:CDGSH-type Zn-finger protein
MSEVSITIRTDGPLKVDGPITLKEADGTVVETREGQAVFLCRCGGSKKKPFCDGTHSRIGFRGAEAAVEAADRGEAED